MEKIIAKDGNIAEVDGAEALYSLRHTASHILAQAIKHLYGGADGKNVQLAIGPAIDTGFYYDIDMERKLTDEDLADIEAEMKNKNIPIVKVYGSIEMELEQLEPEEREEFMKDLKISEPGRERLIHEAYKSLGLISFFTSGTDEVRAWTLHAGANAVDAAGAIHSDLARGFIRAQVVSYDDFINNNASISNCRDKGVLRLEGKEYIVKDGDMIEIRFNV